MSPRPKPSRAATWRCCYRCASLYTAAHPCTCRILAHEEEPGTAKATWAVFVVALLLTVGLFCLLGWKGLL